MNRALSFDLVRTFVLGALLVAVTGCDQAAQRPQNPLLGRWELAGTVTHDLERYKLGWIEFTPESMIVVGVAKRVSYEIASNQVIVYSERGTGISYYFESRDTIYQELPVVGKIFYRRAIPNGRNRP